MAKRYKEYDRLINSHVENYRFITVRQCADIFYTNHVYSIGEANRKLKAMNDKGLIKRCKDKRTNQLIYYSTGLNELPTLSHILLMDFYSKMVKSGAIIEDFKTEVEWKNVIVNSRPMRSDGYMEYIFNSRKFIILIEVDVTHKYEVDNYEKLYKTGILQNKFKEQYGVENYFPQLIIITKKLNPKKHIGNVDVIYLDYDFTDLINKVLL